jgi:hypothetical protein
MSILTRASGTSLSRFSADRGEVGEDPPRRFSRRIPD